MLPGLRPPTTVGSLSRRAALPTVPERVAAPSSGAGSRSFFAFKLHQFISGAGHAYATLEPAGTRTITVDGQQWLPGHDDKRLYSVHFCRECGHEYHPVRIADEKGRKLVLARDIDDGPPVSENEEGDEDPVADGDGRGPIPTSKLRSQVRWHPIASD